MKVLMIDNYDSFTYNLVQYLGELGAAVTVVRNDQISVAEILRSKATHIMISPGPCTPNQAGVSMAAIEALAGLKPILGVCLGHQSIGQVFGGMIIHANQSMHGKTSMVKHTGAGVFSGLPSPFEATRYHSLVIDKKTLPDCLELTAWTENKDGSVDEIMGVRHKEMAIEGVQFHPESILTEHGHDLLRNFLKMKINGVSID
jgi:anthranilate synthase component 2